MMTPSSGTASARTRLATALGLTLVGLSPAALAKAPAAGPGTPDFQATAIQVVQTIPNVTLIADKPAFVRCVFQTSGTVPGGTEVDGLLRVFVDGVEAPYSPLFSDNGPIVPPAAPNILNQDDSLNFIFLPPESSDVVLTFEVNPAGPGQICESDFSNNTSSTASLTFECTGNPELVYVPIDYRPGGGGTPNLPDEQLIKPSVGDNFIQGIYPSEDWDYFAAPPKLWTGNLNGSGSALNSSLLSDLNMMVPQPDFIYGWVPGALPYNGQAIGIPGRAAMGNTQSIRHQRTFAHELGHLFGRFHINNTITVPGIDVEHHLAITENLPQLKVPTLFDIMVAGLLTNQAWVYNVNYEIYINRPEFACGAEESASEPGDNLMISGLWYRNESRVELNHTLVFDGVPSATVPLSEANVIVRAHAGGTVHEFGLSINTSTDSCAAEDWDGESTSDSYEGELAIAGFVTVLPSSLDPHSIDRVEIVEVATSTTMAQVSRSSDRPQVALVSPEANTMVDDQLLLQWSATDADGSALQHFVRYSPDGVRRIPLASNLTDSTLQVDMDGLPRLETGYGFFEVLTTDGLNTTVVRTDGLQNAAQAFGEEGGGGNPPTTEILTPDSGLLFPKGATVVLHSSGWDAEDMGIRGADLVWTSSIDGFLGTGRVTSTADLSVGGHIITVTATDSDGMTATDTAAITITDRLLPSSVICQPDLGFGGPGTSVLMVCGGDLSTGTTADVTLTGATPNSNLWVISGDTNAPFPALGGTLVPVPIMDIVPGMTDGSGDWTLPGGLPGGGGPSTLFAQAVYLDFSQPMGFGISNAVQIDFLP